MKSKGTNRMVLDGNLEPSFVDFLNKNFIQDSTKNSSRDQFLQWCESVPILRKITRVN